MITHGLAEQAMILSEGKFGRSATGFALLMAKGKVRLARQQFIIKKDFQATRQGRFISSEKMQLFFETREKRGK